VVGECLLSSFEGGAHGEDENGGCDADVSAEDDSGEDDGNFDGLASTEWVDTAVLGSVHQELDGATGHASVDDERDARSDRECAEHDEEVTHRELIRVTDQMHPNIHGNAVAEHVGKPTDPRTSTKNRREREENTREQPSGLTQRNTETIAKCREHDVVGGNTELGMDEEGDTETDEHRARQLARCSTKVSAGPWTGSDTLGGDDSMARNTDKPLGGLACGDLAIFDRRSEALLRQHMS